MKRTIIHILLITLCNVIVTKAFSQKDTLPSFSVKKINGVIQLEWQNNFRNINQMNIQRSKDSNKNFITIHSLPDPSVKHYQYQDKTAKIDSSYYRIFILFEGTNYLFTKAIRPIVIIGPEKPDNVVVNNNKAETPEPAKNKTLVTEKKSDPIKLKTETTEDKPIISNNDTITLKLVFNKERKYPKHLRNIIKKSIPPPPVINTQKKWQPSIYIFTGDDGNVIIKIPDADKKPYSVTFLKEEGRPLFQIQKITGPFITLDKVSFLKSGWYYFEIRQADRVIERNKFLITRDF